MGKGNIRKYHARGFVQLANSVANDWTLSTKAFAVYSRIQGLPDDWEFSLAGISKTFSKGVERKDGVDTMRSAVKELEDKGYIIRARERDEYGQLAAGVWVTIDEIELYDAVLEDLENDGLIVITKRPAAIDGIKVKESRFVVTGAKKYDPSLMQKRGEFECGSPSFDSAQSIVENHPGNEHEPGNPTPADIMQEKEENRRSEPVWEKPTQVLTWANANQGNSEIETSPTSWGNTESSQVAACVGFSNVGEANIGKANATPNIKTNQNKDKPTNRPTEENRSSTSARDDGGKPRHAGTALADCDLGSPFAAGEPANGHEPEPSPNAPTATAGRSVGRPNEKEKLKKTFDRLQRSSVNRNMLGTEKDIESTRIAYEDLVKSGIDPETILAAWHERQAVCVSSKYDTVYYPQLRRWLLSEAPDGAREICRRMTENDAEKNGGKDKRSRALRFAIARTENQELDELVKRAKTLDKEIEFGADKQSEADAAWAEAWELFDRIDA